MFLASLLSRFTLQLAPQMGSAQEALDSAVFHVTLMPANGLWMTAHPR